MNALTGIIKEKCPVCGEGKIFERSYFIDPRMPKMKPACPHCGYAFEKETGFFWGAMYVSYGLTIVEIAAILLVSQPFFTEKLDDRMIWIVAAGILLLSAFNYRKSRAIWLYLFTPRKVKEQKV